VLLQMRDVIGIFSILIYTLYRNKILLSLGVKMEQIRTDSSETVFVTNFFSDSESKRIMCGYEYEIEVYR
jgi:hypothetical protein